MCPTRRPYDPADRRPRAGARPLRPARPVAPKLLPSLDAAFDRFAIADGATLGFHHHLRNGDAVLNQVLAVAAGRGLRQLTIAASSLFPVHAPLAAHIEAGVVGAIFTGYVTGPVGDAVMARRLGRPLVLQSHGGRARAIASGDLPIDVAFVAAPRADRFGAATGALGRAACGPLGYPMVDADYARAVVVVAEEIADDPLARAEIGPDRVDAVVPVDCIGDPAGILSGATRAAQDETARRIAALAAEAVAASGLLVDGFSFQTGAGGPPLATAPVIGTLMRQRGIRGGFISGGITAAHVALARDGLFEQIVDVQCFDLAAVQSFSRDPFHRAMSAAEYASPIHPEPVVDRLSVMIVGAAEVDLDFNVNVTVGADGRLIGGPGGHPDAAAGARLTVVTTRMASGAHRKLVDRVICRTTPGEDIDVIATEAGLILHPAREELRDRYRRAGLPLLSIEAVAGPGYRPPGKPEAPRVIVEYRDGSEIDRI
jgi:citrate lyase subunit alpha/citrate CoA-transferase